MNELNTKIAKTLFGLFSGLFVLALISLLVVVFFFQGPNDGYGGLIPMIIFSAGGPVSFAGMLVSGGLWWIFSSKKPKNK